MKIIVIKHDDSGKHSLFTHLAIMQAQQEYVAVINSFDTFKQVTKTIDTEKAAFDRAKRMFKRRWNKRRGYIDIDFVPIISIMNTIRSHASNYYFLPTTARIIYRVTEMRRSDNYRYNVICNTKTSFKYTIRQPGISIHSRQGIRFKKLQKVKV